MCHWFLAIWTISSELIIRHLNGVMLTRIIEYAGQNHKITRTDSQGPHKDVLKILEILENENGHTKEITKNTKNKFMKMCKQKA